MRKNIFMVAATIVVALPSCKHKGAGVSSVKEEMPVTTVIKKTVKAGHHYVADIQAFRNVELRSKISGFLEQILVDEGSTVRKGQLLFKISDGEHRAELSRAEAALNSAKSDAKVMELELERVSLLVERKIISSTELDLAKAKLKAAKSRIEEANSMKQNAQTKLSYTLVTSPFDGVIDRIPLKTGSLLSEGTLITSVSDIASVNAYFNISETEYLALSRESGRDSALKKHPVRLLLSDGHDFGHDGKIETVVSEFNENTGSISLRANFPNPNGLLKHKATGKIVIENTVNDALLLPQKSVFEIQDKYYVFTLTDSNIVKMRNFVPDGRNGQYYIVKSGLKQGDRVVFEGIQGIKDGDALVPKNINPDSLFTILSKDDN